MPDSPPRAQGWTPPPSAQSGWTPPSPPASIGWTPPPAATSWSPPPPPGPAWRQVQPGWSPPPAYAAPPYYRGDEYGNSALAIIAGVLLLVIGGIAILAGVGALFAGLVAGPFIDSFDVPGSGGAVAGLILLFALIFFVIGILELAAGIGVFMHKGWARWVGIVLAVIALIFGFFALLGAMSDPSVDGASSVISILWVAANGFIVAALAVAGEHFQRVYRRG